MTAKYDAEIATEIDTAFSHAEAGAIDVAVHQFAFARTKALHYADPVGLANKIAEENAAYARERERHRASFAPKPKATRKVLIMADSLGLPRPDGEAAPVRTYSSLIYDRYPELDVDSFCQRFFTTQNVRAALDEDPDLGRASDFVLHVGLNDCANRMFLENERIALSFLSPDTRNKLIAFTRKYRRDIILRLTPHHYVTPTQFRENLAAIVDVLRARNAGRIVLTSIILPPSKSWPGTPGINRNFANYNLEIMNTVHNKDAFLMDMDRHVWRAQNRGVLVSDGMHLSEAGHQLFCDKCDPFLR